jgi:hypothetical protein
MNAVLLLSLPIANPQQVVYLHTSNPPRGTGTIPRPVRPMSTR